MANISDVFLKIKYMKNGKVQNDDILDDYNIRNIFFDMNYPTPAYIDEEKNIMRGYGRWNYSSVFERKGDVLFRRFLEELKLKGVDNVYFVFLEKEELMCWTAYKIYNIDVENQTVYGKENLINDTDGGKYYEMLKDIPEHLDKGYTDPIKSEDYEEYDGIRESERRFLYEEFLKFLERAEKIIDTEEDYVSRDRHLELLVRSYDGIFSSYENGEKVVLKEKITEAEEASKADIEVSNVKRSDTERTDAESTGTEMNNGKRMTVFEKIIKFFKK